MTPEQQQEMQEKLKKMSPEELAEFQKQQCIFCQIIAGKIPSKKIYEDKLCLAVLDINPAAKGHVLVLPKEHFSIMPQMPDKILSHLFVVSKYLSQAMLRSLGTEGTNLFVANGLVAGQNAQHFMLHLIPRKSGDELLHFEEKLIDQKMQLQVKTVLQDKLNQLLGVNKEVLEVQKELPVEEKEKSAEPEAVAEEQPEEVEEEKPTKKTKPGAKKKSTKKTTKKKEDDDEGASLDDIANLFK